GRGGGGGGRGRDRGGGPRLGAVVGARAGVVGGGREPVGMRLLRCKRASGLIRCAWRPPAGPRRRAALGRAPQAGPAATARPRRSAGSAAAAAAVRNGPSAAG